MKASTSSFDILWRKCRQAFLNARPNVRNDERGAIIVFMAVSMVIMLAMAGLAIDMGAGYLRRARMVQAVDAAALAGARVVREGQAEALNHALAVAQTNGLGTGVLNPPALDVQFGTNVDGETTVTVTAARNDPTFFARIFGSNDMDVVARSQAATPPVDLVLVIDHSGSLGSADAWDDLQVAAIDFVRKFDDSLDQMGLVGFNTRATQRHLMDDYFTSTLETEINSINSAGWTNTGEALRMAHAQMTSGAARARSAKVVVFFTDGRPTAFRGNIGNPGDLQDRVMAAQYGGGGNIRGYWDDPMNTLPDSGDPPGADGCNNTATCFGTWDATSHSQRAHDDGRYWANEIRKTGTYVYSIGLGWAVASYLSELSNEGGVVDPAQVQGRSYIAPTAEDLDAVFDLVASDIFVRLAQ